MKELCLAGGEASPTRVRAEVGSWQVRSAEARALLQKSLVMAPIRKSTFSGIIFRNCAAESCVPVRSLWDEDNADWGGEGTSSSTQGLLACQCAGILPSCFYLNWIWREALPMKKQPLKPGKCWVYLFLHLKECNFLRKIET